MLSSYSVITAQHDIVVLYYMLILTCFDTLEDGEINSASVGIRKMSLQY
jgi:hypothetical protein